MTVENCLGTINMCLFWISLTMAPLSADYYCGTLSLQWPFSVKGLGYFAKVLFFCIKMPGFIHGCTSDKLWICPNLAISVLSFTESLRSTWLASDCNRCWCEASYHLLATDTRQECLYPGIYALLPLWGKFQDGSGDYFEVWCVPSASHFPCIVQNYHNILTLKCLLPNFLNFFVYTLQSEQVSS